MKSKWSCTAHWMRKIQFYRLSRTISKGHHHQKQSTSTIRPFFRFDFLSHGFSTQYVAFSVFECYAWLCLNASRNGENGRTWDRHLSCLPATPVHGHPEPSTKFRYKWRYYYLCVEFSEEWKRSIAGMHVTEIMRTTKHNKHFCQHTM